MKLEDINNLPILSQKIADKIIADLKNEHPDLKVINVNLELKDNIFNTSSLVNYIKDCNSDSHQTKKEKIKITTK